MSINNIISHPGGVFVQGIVRGYSLVWTRTLEHERKPLGMQKSIPTSRSLRLKSSSRRRWPYPRWSRLYHAGQDLVLTLVLVGNVQAPRPEVVQLEPFVLGFRRIGSDR